MSRGIVTRFQVPLKSAERLVIHWITEALLEAKNASEIEPRKPQIDKACDVPATCFFLGVNQICSMAAATRTIVNFLA